MGILNWWGQHWFDLLQSGGVVASLVFTGMALRDETRERRISNLLSLTQSHRELWSNIFNKPDLARVLDKSANLAQKPVTAGERVFVNLVIQHLHSAFRATNNELVIKPESVSQDVALFFGLPIPRAIWAKTKFLQNDDFVAFVDACLNQK